MTQSMTGLPRLCNRFMCHKHLGERLQSWWNVAQYTQVKALPVILTMACLFAGQAPAQEKCTAPVVIPGVRGNATTSKFGDGYITRTSDGKTYTTSRFGSGWITRGSDGQNFTTSKFGDGAITRGRDGQTVTTSRFGSGTISRSSDGATTTTQRFGDGTISRTSSGASATTSRFGSGFTTSQSSGRGGAGVLVVPGSVRCR
jgi:hypothetical protein